MNDEVTENADLLLQKEELLIGIEVSHFIEEVEPDFPSTNDLILTCKTEVSFMFRKACVALGLRYMQSSLSFGLRLAPYHLDSTRAL